MLIRSLEQFLACAGCSSNVPYCSSPRSSSALILLCQLLKSDKLSIFSIGSQKATNSLATKLLISMVSFPYFECSLAVYKMYRYSVSLCQPCVFHMIHFPTHNLQPCHPQNAQSGKQAAIFVDTSLQSLFQHDTPSWALSWKPTGRTHSAPSMINSSVTLKIIQCILGSHFEMWAVIMWSNPLNDLATIKLITTTLLTRIRRHISCHIFQILDSC